METSFDDRGAFLFKVNEVIKHNEPAIQNLREAANALKAFLRAYQRAAQTTERGEKLRLEVAIREEKTLEGLAKTVDTRKGTSTSGKQNEKTTSNSGRIVNDEDFAEAAEAEIQKARADEKAAQAAGGFVDSQVDIANSLAAITEMANAARRAVAEYGQALDEVEALAGPEGLAGGGKVVGMRFGGLLALTHRIKAFAQGGFHGHLPGFGGGDRRLILAEDGEYVVRKEAVKKYGASLFDALNTMRVPTVSLSEEAKRLLTLEAPVKRFEEGGQVIHKTDGTVRFEFTLNEKALEANPSIKALARQLADELHRQSRRM